MDGNISFCTCLVVCRIDNSHACTYSRHFQFAQVYFHVENDLMRGQDAFFSLVDGPDTFKCSKFNHLEMFEGQRIPDWRAIHFSHAALMDVNVGFNNIASYRPKFALRWNSLYRSKCLGEPMPGTQEGGDHTPIATDGEMTTSESVVVESEVETSAEVLAQEEAANSPETVEALDAMEEIEQAITSQFEDAKAELEAQMQYAAAAAEQDADAKADAEYEAFYNDQGKPARILEVEEEEEAAADSEGEVTDPTPDMEAEEPGRILATTEAAEEPAATVPSVEGYKLPEGAMAPGSILERALAPDVPAAPVADAPAVPVPEIPSDPSGERALTAEEPVAPAVPETGNTDYLTPPVPSMPVPAI